MLHPWSHVQANKIFGLVQTHAGRDTFVIVDGAHAWNPRITPAVVQNKLAAARFERPEIRVRGIHSSRGFFICNLNRPLRAYLPVVPRGVAENHTAEVVQAEGKHPALAWSRTGDSTCPTVFSLLASRHVTGEELLSFRVPQAGINLLELSHLRWV